MATPILSKTVSLIVNPDSQNFDMSNAYIYISKILGTYGVPNPSLVSGVVMQFEPIEKNEYLEFVTNPEFVFNLNPEHQTNIDTVKRNYINKQFDLFTLHVKMLIKNNEMFFYKGKYLHSEDYNTYSELQFTNAVNSFPISFEDYTKNAFALFYFTKEEELTINSYWITTKPIDNLLSTFDKELFEWSESNINDFLTSESTHKTEHFSILH